MRVARPPVLIVKVTVLSISIWSDQQRVRVGQLTPCEGEMLYSLAEWHRRSDARDQGMQRIVLMASGMTLLDAMKATLQ